MVRATQVTVLGRMDVSQTEVGLSIAPKIVAMVYVSVRFERYVS